MSHWYVKNLDQFETSYRCTNWYLSEIDQLNTVSWSYWSRRPFFVSFKLMKTSKEVSLKTSLKISVPLKFEPYNLQHCRKNCCKLIFCVLLEQLLSHITFGRLHYYEFTLTKKYNKTLLQKRETKLFKQTKKSLKTCSKSTSKKTRTFWD